MRRGLLILASVAVLTGLGATPALACPQSGITKKSCAAAGGVYAQDRTSRTCTTTSDLARPVMKGSTTRQLPTDGESFYEGLYDFQTVVTTTTVDRQVGNQPVQRTVKETYTTRIRPTGCNSSTPGQAAVPVDLQPCIDRGTFPAGPAF